MGRLINHYPEDSDLCDCIDKVNSILLEIENIKFPEAKKRRLFINEFEEILFSINIYRISIISRLKDISSSYELLWNQKKYIGCFLLARCLLETFSHFTLTAELIAKSNGEIEKITDIVIKSVLGNNVLGDIKAHHINDAIRAHKRLVALGESNPDTFQELYDDLSEFVHPNGYGTIGLYIGFNETMESQIGFHSQSEKIQKTFYRRPLQAFYHFELFNHCNNLLEKSIESAFKKITQPK